MISRKKSRADGFLLGCIGITLFFAVFYRRDFTNRLAVIVVKRVFDVMDWMAEWFVSSPYMACWVAFSLLLFFTLGKNARLLYRIVNLVTALLLQVLDVIFGGNE